MTKVAEGIRLSEGISLSDKLKNIQSGFELAFVSYLPSFHATDLVFGFLFAIAIKVGVSIKGKNGKKYRHGVEYGSARWGNTKDIEPFMDKEFSKNVVLTKTEHLTMNSRPKNPKDARNKNVLIIGGSGSGKTRFWLKPNLMQCHSSYVITDPKGSIVIETGRLLQREGYQIKILNTINFSKSMKYNPFSYIRSEKDILKFVTTLIANTKGESKGGDDFWIKAETLLYTALIGYIWYEAPEEEQNFNTLVEFINASDVREDDEDFKNPVDLMFDKLEKKDPQHFAVRQYKKYKLSSGVVTLRSNLNQLHNTTIAIAIERKCCRWRTLNNGYTKTAVIGIC